MNDADSGVAVLSSWKAETRRGFTDSAFLCWFYSFPDSWLLKEQKLFPFLDYNEWSWRCQAYLCSLFFRSLSLSLELKISASRVNKTLCLFRFPFLLPSKEKDDVVLVNKICFLALKSFVSDFLTQKAQEKDRKKRGKRLLHMHTMWAMDLHPLFFHMHTSLPYTKVKQDYLLSSSPCLG